MKINNPRFEIRDTNYEIPITFKSSNEIDNMYQ